MTTYSVDFLASKNYAKLPPIIPKENGIIYSTDDLMESSYEKEFYPKERDIDIKTYRPNNEYIRNNEIFDFQSSYSDDFINNKVTKQKSLKPITKYCKPTEKISSSTNYNNEFTEKSVEKMKDSRPLDNFQPSRSNEESMMLSNYKEDFVEMKGERVRAIRPNDTYIATEQNEKWKTNYQSEFLKPQMDNNKHSKKIYISTNSLFPNTSIENEYSTNYAENFMKMKEMPEKLKLFKPKSDYVNHGELFSGTSSYTSDFNNFGIIKPEKSCKPLNPYRPPEEPISSTSVYMEQFIFNKKSPRFKVNKPANEMYSENEDYNLSTDYLKELNSNRNKFVIEGTNDFQPPFNYP